MKRHPGLSILALCMIYHLHDHISVYVAKKNLEGCQVLVFRFC